MFLKIVSSEEVVLMRFESEWQKNLLISYQGRELNNSAIRDFDDFGGKFNNDINQTLK